MVWDRAGDIPEDVVSAAITFAQDVAREMTEESDEADKLIERVLSAVHPQFPARVTVEILKGETGRHVVIDPLIDQRKMINAIKEIRNATGWGLKESKDFIEAAEHERQKLPSITREKRHRLREGLRDTGYKLR